MFLLKKTYLVIISSIIKKIDAVIDKKTARADNSMIT